MPLRDRAFRKILFKIMSLGALAAVLVVGACDQDEDGATPRTNPKWGERCKAVAAPDMCCEGVSEPRVLKASPEDVCTALEYGGEEENDAALSLSAIETCARYVNPCDARLTVCAGLRGAAGTLVSDRVSCDAFADMQ